MTDLQHRSPREILLQFAAISNKIGMPVTMDELMQFKDLVGPEVILFILEKQREENV